MNRFEKSAKREFEMRAKSELDVQNIAGALYAFGSELSCLRLFYAYRYCEDKIAFGFSEPRQQYYFRLETQYQEDVAA
jgi:hypothetical protein